MTNENKIKRISKFLSLILRHAPEKISLTLDKEGWANVDELLVQCKKHQRPMDFDLLRVVVATNDKQRFIFNEDETKIRANQGHSIEVELNLQELEPPAFLYHGTVAKFMDAIRAEGLRKMSRQHVHLSDQLNTATKVGSRRGKPIILNVRSQAMYEEGFKFYRSENGVWLTDHVPSNFIEFKK